MNNSTNNCNSKWRTPARVVAVINVVLPFLPVLVCLPFMIFDIQTNKFYELETPRRPAVFGSYPMYLIASMLASRQLFKATKLGRPANEALKLSKYWRTISIGFLVVYVVGIAVCIVVLTINPTLEAESSALFKVIVGFLAIVTVFRVVALRIVQCFIDDLETVVTGSKQMI